MTETSLKAGAARVDITPPMGVEMCGYGPYEKRVCTEVLDRLYARALWLETPRASAVIVSADLCMIDAATRDRVAEELGNRFGMDPRGVMVAATHTHSAPVQVLRIGRSVLVGWPGEVFVELGLELRQRSPVPLTFVASFANGNVGYIPTAAAYESQGRPNAFGVYPTTMTPLINGNLPFRPEAGDILVEQSLAVLADE